VARLAETRVRLDALKPDDTDLGVRAVLGLSHDRLAEDDALLARRWRLRSNHFFPFSTAMLRPP
jgi:hypothetical protein